MEYPRDGMIPKKVINKIEDIVRVFKMLNPDDDTDKIRELMCILYRRKIIEVN